MSVKLLAADAKQLVEQRLGQWRNFVQRANDTSLWQPFREYVRRHPEVLEAVLRKYGHAHIEEYINRFRISTLFQYLQQEHQIK